MITKRVYLNSVEDAKKFVDIVGGFDGYFDLVSGKYYVDAKSILGVFTMDLSKGVDFRIIDTHQNVDDILKAIEPFAA